MNEILKSYLRSSNYVSTFFQNHAGSKINFFKVIFIKFLNLALKKIVNI